jgi:hypothetical protein
MFVFEFILADPLFPELFILIDVEVESLREKVCELAEAEPPYCEDSEVEDDDPY